LTRLGYGPVILLWEPQGLHCGRSFALQFSDDGEDSGLVLFQRDAPEAILLKLAGVAHPIPHFVFGLLKVRHDYSSPVGCSSGPPRYSISQLQFVRQSRSPTSDNVPTSTHPFAVSSRHPSQLLAPPRTFISCSTPASFIIAR